MKTMEITLWRVPLKVTFYRYDVDRDDPIRGHYTEFGRWKVETIEHAGVDIFDLVSDEVIYMLERDANE